MSPNLAPLVPFILVLVHFATDWLPQSHREAMLKAKSWRVRLWHCVKYAFPFWLVLQWMGLNELGAGVCVAWLFVTHFFIDTYIPVMLWAKYLRKDPKFQSVVKPPVFTKEQLEKGVFTNVSLFATGSIPVAGWQDTVIDRPITYESDGKVLEAMFATPVGAILCITMDQFFHIACLLPVAWLVLA